PVGDALGVVAQRLGGAQHLDAIAAHFQRGTDRPTDRRVAIPDSPSVGEYPARSPKGMRAGLGRPGARPLSAHDFTTFPARFSRNARKRSLASGVLSATAAISDSVKRPSDCDWSAMRGKACVTA